MGTAKKYSIVLDTNILVSALGWKGNERKIFNLCVEGELQLCISHDLIKELSITLNYPKFDSILAKKKQDFIENLIELSNIAKPTVKVDIIKDDPDDNNVLECALCCGANYIVSGDNHLLGLKSFKNIKILTSLEFLDLIFVS